MIVRILFNLVPVLLVIDFLLLGRLSHQDIIADLIAFRKIQASGVQAFKDQLRIIIRIKANADDLKAADRLKEFINRNLFLLNPVVKIIVIRGQIGSANVLGFLIKEFAERLSIILDRFQLNAGFLWLVLVYQIILVNPVTEPVISRNHFALSDQVVHCKKEQ